MDQGHTFSAVVKIAGINPYVDVPVRIVTVLDRTTRARVMVKVAAAASSTATPDPRGILKRDRRRLKVVGRIAPDDWFRSTLVPSRSGPTRLYLDTWIRSAAGVEVGDRVRVSLRVDDGSRELELPPALQRALAANPSAQAAWDELTPSRRREILAYLNFLKTPAALERNVEKTIGNLISSQ